MAETTTANSNEGGMNTSFIDQLKEGLENSGKQSWEFVSESIKEVGDIIFHTLTKHHHDQRLWGQKEAEKNKKNTFANFPGVGKKDQPDKVEEENKKGFRKLFKTKFFDNIIKNLQGILKASGSMLMDMLEFFLFMAFVDPNGALLKSLIQIFLKIFIMIVKIIIKLLPTAIKLIIEAGVEIFTILQKEMPNIIRGLLEAFIKAGDILIQKFPVIAGLLRPIQKFFVEVSKMFETFMKGETTLSQFLLDVFLLALESIKDSIFQAFFGKQETKKGKDGKEVVTVEGGSMTKGIVTTIMFITLFYKILKPFGSVLSVVVGGVKNLAVGIFKLGQGIVSVAKFIGTTVMRVASFGAKVFSFLGKSLSFLGKGFQFIAKGFSLLANGIRMITMALLSNPIMLIALGIVAAIALIWVFKDKIIKFFEGIGTKVKEMWQNASTPMKLLMVFLGLLLSPIILVGLAIYGLAKAFKYLAEFDWGKAWDSAMEWVFSIPDKFGDMMAGIWDTITGWFTFGSSKKEEKKDDGGKSVMDSFFESILKWIDVDLPKWWEKFVSKVNSFINFKKILNRITKSIEDLKTGLVNRVREMFSLRNIFGGGNNASGGSSDNGLLTSLLTRLIQNIDRMIIWLTDNIWYISSALQRMPGMGGGAVSKKEQDAYQKLQDVARDDIELKKMIQEIRTGTASDELLTTIAQRLGSGITANDLKQLRDGIKSKDADIRDAVVDAINSLRPITITTGNTPTSGRTGG